MKEKLLLYLDTICEVKTMDNELLVVGRVKQVASKLSLCLDIVEAEGNPMPLTFYGVPVKINLHSSTHGMLVVGGKVYLCNKLFWRISNLTEYQNVERRGYFRVSTDTVGMAELLAETDAIGTASEARQAGAPEPEAFPVRMINISLSGVLLASEHLFECDHYLHLHDFHLAGDPNPFSLVCRVRRCDEETSQGYLCRCSFEAVQQRDSDRLCKAIFALQREMIQKRKNRV